MINPKAAVTSAGFIVLMALAGIWACLQVPADARIAVHFAADGTANGWMTPFPAFFVMPGTAALLWLLFLGIPHIKGRAADLARAPRAYGVLWMLPVVIMAPVDLAILSPVLGLTWSPARLIPGILGLVYILLGNVLGKIPPNPLIGVRTRWTLADDWVWDHTHRFAGWVFVGGGFVLLGYALVLPPGGNLRKVALSVVIVTGVLSVGKSWLLSRQRR